jgi:hypothetical protein
MLTEKHLASRVKLLEGRPIAKNSTPEQFFQLLIDECQAADATIPITKASLKACFKDFNDRWQVHVAQDNFSLDEAYSWPGYMTVLFECFFNWTYRSTALSLQFLKKFEIEPAEVLVFADGFGAASAMVASALPNTKVIANIMGAKQFAIAQNIKQKLDLQNMDVTQHFSSAEVVFAFEALEHFQDPLAVAAELLEKAGILIYTAPWKVEAHGHFKTYSGYPAADFSKVFGKFMRNRGFLDSRKAVNFNFFNGYPRIYCTSLFTLPLNDRIHW